VLFIGH
jgi:DNA replication licensing factor MCM5